jgi:hypothetical protein
MDPEDIKKQISDLLSQDITIPDGHKGALVTFVNLDKVEVALATKVTNTWSVELVASHDWTGGNSAGVMSKYTW